MSGELEKTIEYYETHAAELAGRYEGADVEGLHERLLSTFPPRTRLLEIGCGSGRDAAFLIGRGYQVDCVEASPGMAARADKIHPELRGHISLGQWGSAREEVKLKGGPYDGVYAIAALMHLTDEAIPRALNRVHAILRTGGRFFFSVPLSRPDLSSSGFDSEGRYYLLLNQEQWLAFVEAAGFRDINFFTSSDGLGRINIKWLTCIARKE